jgi:putative transposase
LGHCHSNGGVSSAIPTTCLDAADLVCPTPIPPAGIQHAVWLYLRFTLNYRDVEELLAERGLDVSYKTIRRWVGKFGPMIARNLRQLRYKRSSRWHLDEMVVRINGRSMYLWRAVDDEVLEVLVQRRRNKAAAGKLIGKLLRKQGFAPTRATADKLRSYGAAFKEIGLTADHEHGARRNNRAEVSHQPLRRRERKMRAATYNTFNLQRHLRICL